ELVEHIQSIFGGRGREMPANNLRQADVPKGGDAIPNPIGTAPGIRAEVPGPNGTTSVVYAVAGVPQPMQQAGIEHVLPDLLAGRGGTLGRAEALTGGLIGARSANVPGASRTFRGSITSYATDEKRSVLGVTAESVITEEAARQMAEGAQRALGADVGISATG